MIIATYEVIKQLADKYAAELQAKLQAREVEMQLNDNSHYLVYRVLGVSSAEGYTIDLYQNKGRFLYKYAGSFLENAAKLCFQLKFPEAKSARIPNTLGTRPTTFEIHCLLNVEAYEIKWRDATTDGDHIMKEHTRMKVIAAAGYTPIRLMFYYPNRVQAMRIQAVLEDLYKSVGGQYYHGDAAWSHLAVKTGVDLKQMLETVVNERGL